MLRRHKQSTLRARARNIMTMVAGISAGARSKRRYRMRSMMDIQLVPSANRRQKRQPVNKAFQHQHLPPKKQQARSALRALNQTQDVLERQQAPMENAGNINKDISENI